MENPFYYEPKNCKKLRQWHISNAKCWAFDPEISIIKPIPPEDDLLGLHEDMHNKQDRIRDSLKEKLGNGRFIRVKDRDLQSFFIMYDMPFSRYSFELDDICEEIARTAKNQFEELDMGSPQEGSTDLTYCFKNDSLKIVLEIPPFAEGVLHYIKSWHKGKYVFDCENWGTFDDKPALFVNHYVPGPWEKEVKNLSIYKRQL